MLCSVDKKLRFWNLPGSNPVVTQDCPVPAVSDAVFDDFGRSLIIVGASTKINILSIDTQEWKCVDTEVGFVSSACFSRDGSRFAVGSALGAVSVYSTASLKKLGGHKAHKSEISCVAFTPKGDYVLAGDLDGKISSAPGEAYSKASLLRRWHSSFGPVHCIAASPDRDWLAIGSGETVRVYDCQQYRIMHEFPCGTTRIVRFCRNTCCLFVVVGPQLIFYMLDTMEEMGRERMSDVITAFDIRPVEGTIDFDVAIALRNGELFCLKGSNMEHHMLLADEPGNVIIKLLFQPDNGLRIKPKTEDVTKATEEREKKLELPKRVKDKPGIPRLRKPELNQEGVDTLETETKKKKDKPSENEEAKVKLELPDFDKEEKERKPKEAPVLAKQSPDKPVKVDEVDRNVEVAHDSGKGEVAAIVHEERKPVVATKTGAESGSSKLPSKLGVTSGNAVKASPDMKKEPEESNAVFKGPAASRVPEVQQKEKRRLVVTDNQNDEQIDLLEDLDLSRLSRENRDLVKAIVGSISQQAERMKEEFNRHINAVHLDLLCRIRELANTVETYAARPSCVPSLK
jgi:hypothetical protein